MSIGSVIEKISTAYYSPAEKKPAKSSLAKTNGEGILPIIQPFRIFQASDQSRMIKFVNKLYQIEGPFLTEQERKESYKNLINVLRTLIFEIDRKFKSDKKDEKIIEKYLFSLKMMETAGYKLIEFSKNILIMQDFKDKILDCDSRSFLLLAIAEHYQWEAGIISLPNHSVFYSQKAAIDIDYADSDRGKFLVIEDLNFYIERFNLSKEKSRDILTVNSGEKVFTEYYANVGKYLEDNNRDSEALKYLNVAISDFPHNGLWRALRGDIYYRASNYQKALIDYRAAVDLKPTDHASWYSIGSTFYMLKKYPEAQVALERAKKIAPLDDYLELLKKVNKIIKLNKEMD